MNSFAAESGRLIRGTVDDNETDEVGTIEDNDIEKEKPGSNRENTVEDQNEIEETDAKHEVNKVMINIQTC
jgi:hypothetical protein